MKVKIKGLVFVGFAAAVFAQSAMATELTTDQKKKTVTSQYWVEDYAQEQANRVEIGTETGQYASTSAENFPWTANDQYPSMKVLKAVADETLDAVSVKVDPSTNATDYIDVTESPTGTFTINLDNAPATTAAELTGTLTNDVAGAFTGTNGAKLVTATSVKALIDTESSAGNTTLGAGSTNATVPTSRNVVDYAEAKANKATAIITSGTGQNNTSSTGGDTAYPTTAAVYDFVTSQVGGAAYQRKLTSADTGTLYVGQYDSSATGDQSTWKQIGTKGYLTYAQNGTSGVYEFDINSSQIADSVATDSSQKLVTENAVYDLVDREETDGTTTITSAASATMVPTSKNVYDFVTNYAQGTYQVKNTTDAPMVGYGNAWRQLSASGTTGASGNTYVVMETQTNGNVTSYKINLASDAITTTGAAIAAYTDQNNGDVNDLTTVKAVKEYVNGQVGGIVDANMPTECKTSGNSGVYCALVASYDATLNNNAGGVKYEWTIMAPVPSNP